MVNSDTAGNATVRAGVLARFQSLGIGLAFLVMVIVFSILTPNFFRFRNIVNIANQTAIISVVAFGMTIVMLSGGIDLSVGSIASLTAVLAALMLRAGFPSVLVIVLGLLPGATVGLANAWVVQRWNVQPFLVTLGMMSIARGASLIVSGGQTTYIDNQTFLQMTGRGYIGPVPVIFLWTVVFFVLTHVLMTYTTFGRKLRAVGGNIVAARQAGVSVVAIRTCAFLISGALASIGGVMVAGRLASGLPTVGVGMELDAIAAAVLGGTGFKGEGGSMVGTLLGALVMGTLINGLTILGINTYVQEVAKGAVIILAIVLAQSRASAARSTQ